MHDVSLVINGQAFRGWESVSIRRAIDAISGAFSLGVTDRWQDSQQPWEFTLGSDCTLRVERDTILTGYIDNAGFVDGPGEHSIQISGRDRAGDLVDCSAIDCPVEYSRATSLFTIVQNICAPYGVDVDCQVDYKFPKFSLQTGESCFEAIDRACRAAGALATNDGCGGIRIVQAITGESGEALVVGKNVKRASASYDMSNRYRDYVVLSQQSGGDDTDAEAIATVKGTASDPDVTRPRTLKIKAEEQIGTTGAQKRALWEAATRAGKSGVVSIEVQGWRDSTGKLWEVNTLHPVWAPKLQIRGVQLLLTSVDMSMSKTEGTVTRMQLCRPDAYLPEPLKATKISGGSWDILRKYTGSRL
jgi:prophage tail gpP-like protein